MTTSALMLKNYNAWNKTYGKESAARKTERLRVQASNLSKFSSVYYYDDKSPHYEDDDWAVNKLSKLNGSFFGNVEDRKSGNMLSVHEKIEKMVAAGKPSVMTYTNDGAKFGHAVFVIGTAWEEWLWQYTFTYSDGISTYSSDYEFYEWDLVLDPEGDGSISSVLARKMTKGMDGKVKDESYPGKEEVSVFGY